MGSFKKLSKADITTVPYRANKQWNLSYGGDINDSYAVGYVGKNEPFHITGSTTTNSQYRSLIYSQINQLFYQAYSGSLNTGSLMFNVDTYESASQQRPTASYFNYNTNPVHRKIFPTSANQTIGVISINQDIFGSKILPTSFKVSSSSGGYNIIDDGNGNLIDTSGYSDDYVRLSYVSSSYFYDLTPDTNIPHVGNIYYAHGLIVITHQDAKYQNIATGSDSRNISFKNEHYIYENEVRCIVRESDFNLTYNPTLLQNGGEYMIISGSLPFTSSFASPSGSIYTLTGSFDGIVKDFATGSVFQPYVTTIGLYNNNDELLMVAKLAKPIMLSPDTDTTFIVRYDT